MHSFSNWTHTCVIALLLFVAACGDDETSTMGDAGVNGLGIPSDDPGIVQTSCTRDPKRMAEARTCLDDSDCACGTGCEVGKCTAACKTDKDCGDKSVCDRFGRCRKDGDAASIAPLTPPMEATLRPDTTLLRFVSMNDERPVTFVTDRGAAGTTRIQASGSLQVRCGDEGAYASECTFEDVPAETTVTVWAKLTTMPAAAPAIQPKSNLHVGVNVRALETQTSAGGLTATTQSGKNFISAVFDPTDREPTAADGVLQPGTYEGSAVLTGLGTKADVAKTGEVAAAGVALKLTAQIYGPESGSAGVIEITDPRKILAPSGSWIGSISAGERAQVKFPSVLYLKSDAWAGAGLEVLAEAPAAPARLNSGNVTFELAVRLRGVIAGERAPYLRWTVVLSKSGELPADAVAPKPAADATLTAAADRAFAPLPWERALRSVLGTIDIKTMSDVNRNFVLDAFAIQSAARRQNHGACIFDPAALDDLGLTATRTVWSGPLLSPSLQTRFAGPFRAVQADPSISVAIDPKLRARTIPCAVDFEDAPTNSTCAMGTKYHLQPVDICDAVAAKYGCDVIDAPAGARIDLTATGTVAASGCNEDLPAAVVKGNVRRACTLPPLAQGCAETALCIERDILVPHEGRFSTTKSPYSGDLKCGLSDLTIFAADANFEKAPCPASDPACDRLGAQALIDACSADIARIQTAGPPSVRPGSLADLEVLLAESPACVDAARLVLALGYATEADRTRARDPSTAKTVLASRIAQRLLQRYLSYGAFQAREAAQRELLGEMFRAAGGRNKLASADEVLAQNLPLWDLVLHPRFATALDQMGGDVLATPDYRPIALGASVSSEPEHEQTQGLPIALLDLSNAQLALLEPRLEWAALDRDPSALERLSEAVRYALVVRPLAAAMYARANEAAGGSGPAWRSRYENANAELEAHLNKLGMAAAAIVEGRNPLGIEDDDLPLYFYGDEKTPTTRYSAISDFLIGQMPGSAAAARAWAPSLIEMARQGWETAMPLFIEQLDREIQVRQANNERAAALDAIRLDFGQRLAEYCYPDMNTIDLLENWTSFDPDTCFYNADKPGCEVREVRGLSVDSLKYQACVLEETRKISPASTFAARGQDPKLDAYLDDFETKCGDFTLIDCKDKAGRDAKCVRCSDKVELLLTPSAIASVLNASDVSGPAREDIERRCLHRFPKASPTLPGEDDAPNSRALRPECYNGSIGEAVFDLRQAREEAREAQAEFDGNRERYARALDNCTELKAEASQRQALRERRDALLNSLDRTKMGLAITTEFLDTAADCLDSVISAAGGSEVIGKTVAIGLSVGACVTRTVSAGFKAGILEVERQIPETERMYQQLIDNLDERSEVRQCLAEAASEFVAQKAQALRLTQAANNVAQSLYRIQELKISAATVMADGQAALETAKGRFVAPLAHDFWIDDQVKRFWRDMRMARRVTYLAVRAVEYEQQVSLAHRDTVLKARLPDELWGVLEELWSMSGVRSVRGNRPTDLKVVLSMRNQLLQIADLNDAPAAEQGLSEVERFRLLLTSPQYASYDDGGKYLGQRIPFTLAPLSAVSGGQSPGVPVLAGTDCAERLWSVNASLLGPADMYVGDEPTFARIDILKSNTFFSQWCGRQAEDAPEYQTASVRPSRNLFRDPEYGVAGGVGAGLGLENETGGESRARIEAYFNVKRADFEADDYASGATSELAARGLYGQYALFIPRDVLSLNGGKGLALNKVEDILLRLDYVSVAK